MWVWHLVRRVWLDALIWALALLGCLALVATADTHGVRLVRTYSSGAMSVRMDAVTAYALALVPFWAAAVLHLLRQRAP
jgi:hypothetical protein